MREVTIGILAAVLALVAFFGVDFAAWVRDEKRRARNRAEA